MARSLGSTVNKLIRESTKVQREAKDQGMRLFVQKRRLWCIDNVNVRTKVAFSMFRQLDYAQMNKRTSK